MKQKYIIARACKPNTKFPNGKKEILLPSFFPLNDPSLDDIVVIIDKISKKEMVYKIVSNDLFELSESINVVIMNLYEQNGNQYTYEV
jgi:hypothetical protein